MRTTLRRHPERGLTKRAEIDAILDEAVVAHVGFIDDGIPVVIPTTYARVGTILYIHGAASGRLIASLSGSQSICVTVTLLDGLVLARSAFNHSMNYRSVMIFGKPRVVAGRSEKERAFTALVEHIVPGRASDARAASDGELIATGIIALDLDECSAKRRSGAPKDASSDASLPHWAGVIPARLIFGDPQPDEGARTLPLPAYLKGYARG